MCNTHQRHSSRAWVDASKSVSGSRVMPAVVGSYRFSGVGLKARLNRATNPLGVASTPTTARTGSPMVTVAVDGDRYVGESQLWLSPEPDTLRTGLTGTRRAYRRRFS